MCLGVPGKIITIDSSNAMLPMARISFGGVIKETCLAYVPDAQIGEYVIVHAGFALSKLNEDEAQEVFDLLKQMDDLAELDAAQAEDGV